MDTQADAEQSPSYFQLQIKGPVSVERVDERVDYGHNILIMGPTGAGKSTFVEALGYQGTEKLSSNGLDGFTQELTTYSLVNATYQDSVVYILDTPGFADPKISELSIISMVKEWLEKAKETYFSHILFFTPITHIRLSGSRKQVLKTFQAITGIATAQNVVLVTTMWNTLGSDDKVIERSETTFNELQKRAWKDFKQRGSRVVKFHNTQESALSILDNALQWPMRQFFALEDLVRASKGLQESTFAPDLQNDLKERIQALVLRKENIEQNLNTEFDSEESMKEMSALLLPQLEEIEKDIAGFTEQLNNFVPQEIQSSSVPDESTASVEPPKLEPQENIVAPSLPQTDNVNQSLVPPVFPSDHIDPITHSKGKSRVKVTRLMNSLRCWGKDTLRNYDA